MNQKQRARIDTAMGPLYYFTCPDNIAFEVLSVDIVKSALSALQSEVEEVANEEREKFDNMSEGLQASPTGQKIEEAADALEGIDWPEAANFDFDTEEGRESIAEAIDTLLGEVDDAIHS